MKITIAERLAPFSHAHGMKFLLPHTSWVVQVYPTRLIFTRFDGEDIIVDLPVAGPVREFTAQLDLERGLLRVHGKTGQGYMRYTVQARLEGIAIEREKGPIENRLIRQPGALLPVPKERLSLGSHKAQDWDAVKRRMDFAEIFPLWMRMAAWAPKEKRTNSAANFRLVDACREKIAAREKTAVLEAFELLFLAAFEGALIPRLNDAEFQGIIDVQPVEGVSPLPLLTEGAELIRSLFIQEGEEIALLPCLPPDFHAGRMTDVHTANGIRIAMEWSKKSLRRASLVSDRDQDVRLKFPKGIVSCRKGKRKKLAVEGVLVLSMAKGETVHLDRFEK